MRAPGHADWLLAVAGELEPLATGAEREALTALAERLRAERLRILVVGEAKRGKSTLVNALLGREVLPAGVTPLTAVATTVVQGADGIEVAFRDGRRDSYPLDAIEDYGTERGNPGNRSGVAGITVRVDAPVLARGVEIVDTPGTGSVHEHNTAMAGEALLNMDVAIFVLSADPPVSATERDLLTRVSGLSVTTFVVLNKADYLDAAGLKEAVEFTAAVARAAADGPVRVYPVSARAALAGADPGFEDFRAALLDYLSRRRGTDLRLSAAGQLRRIAGTLLDEVLLAQRAATMRGSEAAARVEAFAARLAAVRRHGEDAEAVASAESRRLLLALNEAAGQAVPRLAGLLRETAGTLLAGELAHAPAARIEREGRAALQAQAARYVQDWRRQQQASLESGLAGLDGRLADELAAELEVIRGAAAELLGLDLAVPAPQERLRHGRPFFPVLRESVDQAELLAGAVRRRMPGELGRRLAREHLRAAVADLATSQVGRARADLQFRLAEAARDLIGALRRRYAAGTGRLAAALQEAAALREETTAQAAGRLGELAGREQALRRVLAKIADAGQPEPAGFAPAAPRPAEWGTGDEARRTGGNPAASQG